MLSQEKPLTIDCPPVSPKFLLLLSVLCLFSNASAACMDELNYNVSFRFDWTLVADPEQPTDNNGEIGFGRVYCAAHNEGYSMWKPRATASKALQDLVGEELDEKKLLDELESNNVSNFSTSELDFIERDQTVNLTLKVKAKGNNTLLSCITLIVPSPGWFVGIQNRNMCNGSNFIRTESRFLVPWTSGIYNDTTYLPDELTKEEPPVAITQVTGKPDKFGEVVITNATSDETSSDSMSACFPGGELVLMADRTQRPVEAISRSDLVASTDPESHSEIFMHSHADPHLVTRFVRIQYLNQNSTRILRVSPGHYVYRRGEQGMVALVRARDITAGDFLIGADSLPRAVIEVTSEMAKGLFNPHSLSGDLIVSGVRVSCFTTAVEPRVASSAMAPLRLLHRIGSYKLQHLFSDMISKYANRGRLAWGIIPVN